MTRPLEQRSLTVAEAARYYGTSKQEIKRRIAAGELHTVGQGRNLRIPVGILERGAAA